MVACLVAAHDKLWFDPEDVKPAERRIDALDGVVGNFGNKKQIKKLEASGKGATIVRASFDGAMRSVYVWLAVGADGAIKAVYMQEVLMD